jgi:hypothetical protein
VITRQGRQVAAMVASQLLGAGGGSADLLVRKQLVEEGRIKPSIDRRHALRDTADALRHVGEGHARGRP